MDQNKLKKLVEVDFSIPAVCSMCKHGNFEPGAEWGTCGLHSYDHLKHSDKSRQLSIFRGGRCPRIALDEARTATLGRFNVFLRK